MVLRYDGQPETVSVPGADEAARVVAECDTKLARYRAALEAGTDPKLVAQWTAEVQARRAEALACTHEASQRRLTKDEIRAMIKPLGRLRDVLAEAQGTPEKAEVYRNLSLRLTYEPGKQLVRP